MDLVPWTNTTKLITTCTCGVCLAFVTVVGAVGIHLLRASENMRKSLIVLFAVCVVSADLYLIGVIITNSHAVYEAPVFVQMGVQLLTGFLSIVYLCLLVTLVLRLQITFEQSVWKVSGRVQICFGVALSAWVCLLIAINITYYFGVYEGDAAMWIVTGHLYRAATAIYAILCAVAVYLFVRNLMRLAESQASSMDLDNPVANKRQIHIIELSTKYLLLFLFAIISSLLSAAVSEALGDGMWGILPPIDLCINVLCLLLQYPLANAQYRSACNIVHSCMVHLLTRRIERRMKLREDDALELANHERVITQLRDEHGPQRPQRRTASTGNESICCLRCCRDKDDGEDELEHSMTPAFDDEVDETLDYDVIDVNAGASERREAPPTELSVKSTQLRAEGHAGSVEMTLAK